LAVLIDTDLLVSWEREPGSGELEQILGDEDRAISVITVSELLHGVHRATGSRRARRRAFVEHMLAAFEAIPITEPVARVHADVWADLAGRGEAVGAHDLWIAATALAAGFGVATRNADEFGRVPGLRVLSP
jgi:tRNA(fMet)-specific endonuclease VapC